MLLLVRTSWYRVTLTWRSDERYHGRDEHHDGAQSLKSHWFMALTWQENLLCHALVRYMFTWTENAWRSQSILTRHDSWVHVMSTLSHWQTCNTKVTHLVRDLTSLTFKQCNTRGLSILNGQETWWIGMMTCLTRIVAADIQRHDETWMGHHLWNDTYHETCGPCIVHHTQRKIVKIHMYMIPSRYWNGPNGRSPKMMKIRLSFITRSAYGSSPCWGKVQWSSKKRWNSKIFEKTRNHEQNLKKHGDRQALD